MDPRIERIQRLTRRALLGRAATGLGVGALAHLLSEEGLLARSVGPAVAPAPRARRVICLYQSGGPSQMDLFDPKPEMAARYDQDLPDEIRKGQRLTTMTSKQKRFPIAPSVFRFTQHGESGAWLSNLLPHTAAIADKLCFVRSMHTDAINHDPAITFLQTGAQIAGRPSMGSWLSYGLGSECRDLPTFVAMSSRGSGRPSCQPLPAALHPLGRGQHLQ